MEERNKFFAELLESGQFKIDDYGHTVVFGEYMLIMPVPAIIHIMQMLERELGPEKAAQFLREAGGFQVEQALQRYKKRFDIGNVTKQKIIDFEKQIMNIIGFGNVDMSFGENDIVVVLKNPAVAGRYRKIVGKSKGPIDHYFAGMTLKVVTTLLGAEYKIEETQCAAMNGDICRFVLTPKKKAKA